MLLLATFSFPSLPSQSDYPLNHEPFSPQMTRLTDGMSYDRYMQLYTVAYNYCTSSRMISTGANDPLGGVGARCEYSPS